MPVGKNGIPKERAVKQERNEEERGDGNRAGGGDAAIEHH
jgi:hypothetical protein